MGSSIDDIAAQRASRHAVAADVEVAARLLCGRISDEAGIGQTARRNGAGNFAAGDSRNLRVGYATGAGGGEGIRAEAFHAVRHGVDRAARREWGEVIVARRCHTDVEKTWSSWKRRRTEIKRDVEDAVCDCDAVTLINRTDFIAAGRGIVQPELKVISGWRRIGRVVQTALIVERGSLRLNRDGQKTSRQHERQQAAEKGSGGDLGHESSPV